MDSLSDFPLKSDLNSSLVSDIFPTRIKAWNGVLTSSQFSSKPFSVSFLPSSDNLALFSEGDVSVASIKWGLTLVGYSLEGGFLDWIGFASF
ncbi:hypothetical protein KFK09_002483 [Dendrobium nobile]|uniref:Uncharacterized protein n=1 Tax=Dendrobium nobile TaxID=94219 RepID=A0A8T3C6J2_DENNO|nr:hypothetical protein KFK09_002483 [Dendrobium nobile]